MLIGIDLGTTNSLVAYFDGQKACIIPNRLGKNLTPSIISIDDQGIIYVGETAKERGMLDPSNTASVFKRGMGTDEPYSIGGQTFRAEELSSFVLRSLKEDAEHFLGEPVTEAIISVPAYFNDRQRKATRRAGELAGLKVERIINEPTAAALAHGITKQNSVARLMVVDLGGGTFDVTVLDQHGNLIEIHAIAGDNFLGGEDFTDVLCSVFLKTNGLELEDLTLESLVNIRKCAEICKIGFSSHPISGMSYTIGDNTYSMALTAKQYKEECEDLLIRIKKPIERAIRDASIMIKDLDAVILVGGATRMPMVREYVSELLGLEISSGLHPDEAVVVGAAIQCGMKQRDEAIREIILTEVCPFTLGTEVARVIGDYKERGHYLPIIERNTVIPVSRTETLYTLDDNQTFVRVKILQGESRLSWNNLTLGELVIPVPPKKAGEVPILVTYTYDVNSLLEVVVKVSETGEEKKIIIQQTDNPMSDAEVQQRLEELSYLKINPRDQEENKLVIFRGERLYEETFGDKRQSIGEWLFKFDQAMRKQNREEIESVRKDFSSFLDDIESSDDSSYFEAEDKE